MAERPMVAWQVVHEMGGKVHRIGHDPAATERETR